jgi:hypothetical protein
VVVVVAIFLQLYQLLLDRFMQFVPVQAATWVAAAPQAQAQVTHRM